MNHLSYQNYQDLLTEKQFLADKIAVLPASARLTRKSVESRLRQLDEILQQLQPPTRKPAVVRITFRGKPVIGSHGIFAEFGTEAVKAFVDTVAAAAASTYRPLHATGRIPHRDQNQLVITGTAVGSFGFELEERWEDLLSPEEGETPVAAALDQLQDIFQSLLGSDDDIAESVSGISDRVLEKIRSFLKRLADNDAYCALEQRGRSFRFTNAQQVKNCLGRIEQSNLHEAIESLTGQFEGALPGRRTFEFMTPDQTYIAGKISSEIARPFVINRHLYESVEIRVKKTQVGNGTPKYILLEIPEQWTTETE